MATINGGWVNYGSASWINNVRLRVVTTVNIGSTSASWTLNVYMDSDNAWGFSGDAYDYQLQLGGGGNATNGVGTLRYSSRNYSAGATLLWTITKSANLNSAEQKFDFDFWSDYTGKRATVNGTITLPPAGTVASAVPAQPSALTFTVAGNTVNLTGTVVATSTAPVTSIYFGRESATGAGDGNIKVENNLLLTANASRSATDQNFAPDSTYRWGLYTSNSRGNSTIRWTAWVKSDPQKPPTEVNLSRTGPSSMTVHWNRPAGTFWDGIDFAVQAGNENSTMQAWKTSTNVTASSYDTNNTGDLSANVRVAVRPWVYRTPGGEKRYGPITWTPWITAPVAPGEPISLSPTGVVVVRATNEPPYRLTWVHNSTDGLPQTGFALRWRRNGGAWVEVEKSIEMGVSGGENSYYDLPITQPGTYEWQVMTISGSSVWGPFSAVAQINAVQQPTISVTSPTAVSVYDSSRLAVAVTYLDPQGSPMSAWGGELRHGGVVIENLSGLGSTSVITFKTALETGKNYEFVVWAESGYRLRATSQPITISTSFQFPHRVPITSARWVEENGEAQLITSSDASGMDWMGAASPTSTVPERQAMWEDIIQRAAWHDSEVMMAATNQGGLFILDSSGPSSNNTITLSPAARWPVVGGDELIVRAKRTHANAYSRWRATFYDADGNPIASEMSSYQTGVIASNDFEGMLFMTVPTLNAASMSVELLVDIQGGNATVELSDLSIGISYGNTAPVSAAIERSTDGLVTWERITGQLPLGSLVLDNEAPLNSEVWYRTVSASATGVETSGAPVMLLTPSDVGWLTGSGRSVALRFNQVYEGDSQHEVELVQYLGDEHPTPHYGTAKPRLVSASASLLGTTEQAVFEELLGSEVFYRDPTGRGFLAAIRAGVKFSNSVGAVTRVSFSVQEVQDERRALVV